ncbi:DDE-type integrase/transposase/recombinase [Crateriforma conspicua]|uniref:Integrase core domain protein n=1 Tax=Crateriforma conspicua TaxID=2527996 RepID=A0A5C5XRF3_9PLAN|nr:DDE-type integrase/transposase/recombinase [Crateriforma conspicua]TWT65470.1 Integrase core domain protein [Crateriforma conspicua]
MRVNDSLRHLGVPRGTYYRWKKERAWEREKAEPVSPVQAFEALPEEKLAVLQYALEHPEIRHREMSWRMIDEDVAYLSASTVYRILRAEELMHYQRGRVKRYRDEAEKASRPDEIWATDLMYVKVGGVQYYLVTFIDEYSRYLVHWELLSSMDGHSISTAAQRAIETLKSDCDGEPIAKPMIRSDNGSGFISGEFVGLLSHHGLTHHRIRPHCPEENGIQERFNRTLREGIEDHELSGRYDTQEVIGELISNYNAVRLHSSLGFQTPATWYRGNPSMVEQARRLKLEQARHRRKQINLGIRQRTLPFPKPESVSCN